MILGGDNKLNNYQSNTNYHGNSTYHGNNDYYYKDYLMQNTYIDPFTVKIASWVIRTSYNI